MAEAVARPKTSGPSGPSGSGPTESGSGKVQRLVAFYHGVMAEMKRVTWPDFPQVRSATVAIIIFVLLLGLFITLLDFLLQGVFIKWIPALFSGR